MIDLKTDPDFLIKLSDDMDGNSETARDIRQAAHDLKNLRDYTQRLEWNVNQMSGEINSIRTQRDDAAAALLAIIRPELESAVQEMLNERVGDMQADIEDLKGQCEEIPNGDEITDHIREWFQYEAKFSITLD